MTDNDENIQRNTQNPTSKARVGIEHSLPAPGASPVKGIKLALPPGATAVLLAPLGDTAVGPVAVEESMNPVG